MCSAAMNSLGAGPAGRVPRMLTFEDHHDCLEAATFLAPYNNCCKSRGSVASDIRYSATFGLEDVLASLTHRSAKSTCGSAPGIAITALMARTFDNGRGASGPWWFAEFLASLGWPWARQLLSAGNCIDFRPNFGNPSAFDAKNVNASPGRHAT